MLDVSSVTIAINNLGVAVNENFEAGGETIVLALPAGPFVRVEMLNASLTIDDLVNDVVLSGSFSFEQATRVVAGLATTITSIGVSNVSFTLDDKELVNVTGALVILPTGIAGVLSADLEFEVPGFEAGATISVGVNTTGVAVNETVTVGDDGIVIRLGASPAFQIAATDLKIEIGNFVTIEGDVAIGSDGTFAGDDLLLFVGAGPLTDDDGNRNPDAIGVLLSEARVGLVRINVGGVTTYALDASGRIELVGLEGLVIESQNARIRINTTGQAIVRELFIVGSDGAPIVLNFATIAPVLEFKADIGIEIGGVLRVGGNLSISRQPNGVLDFAISGASIAVDIEGEGEFGVGGGTPADFSIQGNANFSVGGVEGFRLQNFKVNGFSIFGFDGGVAPGAAPVANPTADLLDPFNGKVVDRNEFNALGHIDVVFNDPNGLGVKASTITDATPEFVVKLNGQVPPGLTVSGVGALVTGSFNVYRYNITAGSIADPGELSIDFIAGSFQDNGNNSNFAESEFIGLVNRPSPTAPLPPPAPVAALAGPSNGGALSVLEINGKRYIDVTFTSRDGSAINDATINGDEFTLTGTALTSADVKLLANTGGRPDIVGQPLKMGSNTYRYFFADKDRTNTIGLFQAGEVEVNFRAGSFATVDGGLAVARTERFTIDAAAAGEAAGTGTIAIGPLELQGPSVGIADIGFKDGFLVLTIAIGVDRASLNFGGGSQPTGQAGQPPQMSQQQGDSGVTADLIGVLGTFDIGVDVFALLSGDVRINVPGKFTFSVQSLEVLVPNVVRVTAEGINIQYTPFPERAEGQTDAEFQLLVDEWNTQELLRVESAEIFFPKFEIRGRIDPFDPDPNVDGDEIPGLVVRPNGFALGTAEPAFGIDAPPETVSGQPATQMASSTATDSKIKIGGLLELDDIRIGVRNFEVIFGQGLDFDGSIFVATGGATFFPGSTVFTAKITDRDAANDVRADGTPDDEALRFELEFENGRVKGFIIDVDTLEIKIANELITLTAVDFFLDTGAADDEELVSFVSIGAKVKIGSLLIGGEGRNFAFLGDGTFLAKPGFGVFLTVGSATGESFKWPSWLPVKVNAVGIEWPDFNSDPGRFLITLSVSVSDLPAVAGLEFSGAINGVKIDPFLLLEGKFPIVDIQSFGITISGKVFGGELEAGLVGGIMKLDANNNQIGIFDSTTVVDQRVLFVGIQGGFSLPGLGGITIQFGLSELGPLGVLIGASVPGGIVLEPNTGLAINDFTAGVEFFKSLPSIEDPFELRNPAFGPSTELTAEQWLNSLQAQVVAQVKAIDANPSLGGFAAAFTAPMTITGGAKLFSIYTSKETFNGEVQIKISTDGKFLITGKLNFAADNISLSAKLYAGLSNVAAGDITILFLADIPDQIRLLTIHGKLKMGFKNAAGEDVEFTVVDESGAAPVALAPSFSLIDPAIGSIDANRINSTERRFNGQAFIDVELRAPSGAKLDFESIFDTPTEFTLTVNGTVVAVSGVPVPVITEIGDGGVSTTFELVPNDGETLTEALERTGTTRFRYTIDEAGYTFPRGVAEVDFGANSFKNLDVTLENGTVVAGVSNEAGTLQFTVEGTTAVLLDPGVGGGVDIADLNARGFLDVVFRPAVGGTLDDNSIFDPSAEFAFGGAAAAGVTLVDMAPEKITERTFRYFFTGEFILGEVSVDFVADTIMDLDLNGNRAFSQSFTVEGATADLVNPGSGGVIGQTVLNDNGFLVVRFQPTSGAVLNQATIDGDEVELFDPQGNLVQLAAIPERLVIDADGDEVTIGAAVGDFQLTNRYLYRFTSTLDVGLYTVQYLAGSFEDQSGFANFAETEIFLVQLPTASVVDPLPFDTFDREVLNDRDFIDVAFTPVTGSVSATSMLLRLKMRTAQTTRWPAPLVRPSSTRWKASSTRVRSSS